MLTIKISILDHNRESKEEPFLLNGADMPAIGSKICIDRVHFTVKSVYYETKLDPSTGSYYFDNARLVLSTD